MVAASYFDGRSTRVRDVRLSVDGPVLRISGEDVELSVAIADVRIDEQLGRAPRRLRLPEGAYCEVRDVDHLATLLEAMGHRDGWVDRLQRKGLAVTIAVVACVAIAAVGYLWGLPLGAAALAERLPAGVGTTIGTQVLRVLDGGVLQPTGLPESRRNELSRRFSELRKAAPEIREARILFRRSPALHANAFALPDGTVVLLDDLVASMNDDRLILAVLAHELGHVSRRHTLRLILQSSAVGAFLTFYVGDVSQLLAAAPAAALQARYSRELETEADDYGAALLARNGLSPALLADALERLVQTTHEQAHPAVEGYVASHPPTDERMKHLRALAKTLGSL